MLRSRWNWLYFMMICGVLASAQESPKPGVSPLGTWRGEAKCVVRPSGCNDEDSLYRFSAIGGSRDRVRLSASKIVAGRQVDLGDLDCRFVPAAGSVDCTMPNGNSLHFEAKDASMDGRMNLADGTLWRRFSFRKVDGK